MSQKIAFITGGNRGLGFQTALELKAAGVKSVIGSRDLDQGEASRRQTPRRRRRRRRNPIRHHQAIATTRPPTTTSTRATAGSTFWLIMPASPPALFPATAPSTPPPRSRPTCSTRSLKPTSSLRLPLTRVLLPLIKKSPAGRIVNLSSILSSLTLHADPASPIYNAKSFAYDASKTALNAFTIHLAYELRDTKIKVNSAHPGWVKTDMGGPQATMELSEGAKTSAALALLPDDGPTGGFFHLGKPLPW